jgi:drug/metabolite transporter (DMT)-like permease
MTLFALSLLVASASLHMSWNLLIKQAGDRSIVTWWGLVAITLACLPLVWAERLALLQVWPYAVAGAFFQLLYYSFLTYAYNRGDFSLVYPVARGAAPLFIALWSFLFLDEWIPWVGAVGLATIVAGILLIGIGGWRSGAEWRRLAGGLTAPLLIALCISGYSVIDGAAVRQAPPLAYTALGLSLSMLLLTPPLWAQHNWQQIRSVGRRHWRRIGLIGLGNYVSYGLVLIAYAQAPVSYVGAVREMSIVFAALAGWLWLREPFGLMRTLGALVVVAGIVLVTVAG